MPSIKAVIFDIDFTLIYGTSAQRYFDQYPERFKKMLSEWLYCSPLEAEMIISDHRKYFNDIEEKVLDTYGIPFSLWYDTVCTFNPHPHIQPDQRIIDLLHTLKNNGLILGALTDGPFLQAKKLLNAAAIDENLFKFIIGWQREAKPPKFGSPEIYKFVAEKLSLKPSQILMVGDSLVADIIPAKSIGYQTFHVSSNTPTHSLLDHFNFD